MDHSGTNLTILARIPDLSISPEKKASKSSLISKGRILNQAISFKLLAVAVLLLIVVALAPKVFKRGDSSDTSVATESAPAWGGSGVTASSETATVGPASVAKASATMPAQASSRLTTNNIALPGAVASAMPSSASVDEPLMSAWPNPNHPISSESGGMEPQSGANQPMALRPSEYIRDSHDSTRSSIH